MPTASSEDPNYKPKCVSTEVHPGELMMLDDGFLGVS